MLRILCTVSLLMLMTWHYKRLTNCRQHAHIEILNLCMRASRASEENCRISAFKTCYFFHYFCWYFRYFVGIIWHSTVKYWGGGVIIQPIPHPKILGGIYPPHPPGINTHVCVLNHFFFFFCQPIGGGGGGGGHVPPPPPPPPVVTPLLGGHFVRR